MPRAGIFIATGATAALAYLAHRSLAKVGRAIDEAFVFGDVICLPPEVQFGGQRKPGGEAGCGPATEAYGMFAHHPDGGV